MSAAAKRPAPPAKTKRTRLGGEVRSDNLRAPDIDPARPFPSARGVLSREEIEALLRPDLPDAPRRPVGDTSPRAMPDLAREERERADREAAERLAARLTLALRQGGDVLAALEVRATERETFRLMVPTETPAAAFACFGDSDGALQAMLVIDAPLAASMAELACGATPEALNAGGERRLTEIDAAVLARVLDPLARHMPGGQLLCLETRSAFAVALAPPGEAVCARLTLRLDGMEGGARLIWLADATLPSKASPTALPRPAVSGPAKSELTAILTARIASLSVPVSRISDLRPGSTLLLGVPPDEPVQLLSGGRAGAVAAEGEIGRRGGRIAVRITRRGPAID